MFNKFKKKLILAAVASIAGISFSTVSLASGTGDGPFFGKKAPGKWIVGLKVGEIDPNVDEINSIDIDISPVIAGELNSQLNEVQNASMIGIVLGYEFARPVGTNGSSTFELEYLSSDTAAINSHSEYEADVLNLFLTYRSAGDLYFKFKAGLSYSDIAINSLLVPSRDFESTSVAAGIGLGYRVGDFGVIELEYSQDSGDADLGILGLNALLEF